MASDYLSKLKMFALVRDDPNASTRELERLYGELDELWYDLSDEELAEVDAWVASNKDNNES